MSQEARRLHYLAAMGITAWTQRAPAGVQAEPNNSPPQAKVPAPAEPAHDARAAVELVATGELDALDWDALRQRVSDCTACPELAATRRQTVFGAGSPQAECLIVGEAPGAEEDARGEPFVGRAGQLLNAMLQAMGFAREQVYIANVLKCRPPGNADPSPENIAHCAPYLRRQIALIEPRLILALGRVAAQHLLQSTGSLGALRGRLHHYDDIPLVVTYHPAYLLRQPADKRRAWDDLRLAMAQLQNTL